MTTPTLDDQTEGALRTALAHAASPHGAPPDLHRRLAAQHYSTGSSRPVIAAGVATAAALSGIAVLAGGRAGEGSVGPTHLSNSQLASEITSAVDNSTGDIFEAHTTGGGVANSSTHWLSADGNTLRMATYAPDGSVIEDETLVTQGGQQVITDVNSDTKTWWTITVPAPTPIPTPLAGSEYPPGGLLAGSPTSAAGVAWLIENGGFTKTGQTATVNGVANAYEIKSDGTAATIAAAFANMEMWIDPVTNLPVQVSLGVSSGVNVYALNAVPNIPRTYTLDPATPIVSNVTWLSPTADNEAQLHSTVPAGFTQVAPPTQAFDTVPSPAN